MAQQSFMGWTFTRRVVGWRRQEDWRAVPPHLRAILERSSGCVGQTRAVEDGFRCARAEEMLSQHTKLFSQARLWLHLVRSGLLNTEHAFQDVSPPGGAGPGHGQRFLRPEASVLHGQEG